MPKKTWKEIRESMHLTQYEMAQRLGMQVQTYQMKESYKRPMRLPEAVKIIEMSGVNLMDVEIKA